MLAHANVDKVVDQPTVEPKQAPIEDKKPEKTGEKLELKTSIPTIPFAKLKNYRGFFPTTSSGLANFGRAQLESENVVVKAAANKVGILEINKEIEMHIRLTELGVPSIVPLKGVWHASLEMTTPYLVTKFMDQGSLRDYLDNIRAGACPALKDEQAVQIMSNIAIGLQGMHKEEIVHRDIKSPNVFLYSVNNGLRASIGDFASTRCYNLKKVGYKSEATKLSGTPGWRPPEAYTIKWSNMYDERYDVFSFGVVFWEIMSGENRKR